MCFHSGKQSSIIWLMKPTCRSQLKVLRTPINPADVAAVPVSVTHSRRPRKFVGDCDGDDDGAEVVGEVVGVTVGEIVGVMVGDTDGDVVGN